MSIYMQFFWCFIIGGAFCLVAQLLIEYTKVTPARILVGYVVAGVVLHALGIYPEIAELAGCGASVPLTGFGSNLARGVERAVNEEGVIGAFSGGLKACSAGITVAMLLAVVAALVFKSRPK